MAYSVHSIERYELVNFFPMRFSPFLIFVTLIIFSNQYSKSEARAALINKFHDVIFSVADKLHYFRALISC
jgi:hypothetical protein